MAKKNRVITTKGTNQKSILAFTGMPVWSLGVVLNDTGVEVVDGKKIIKAGTAVGGTESTFQNEQAVLSVIAEGGEVNTQGVLMHDVDVTDGDENGTLIIFGFVNEYRFDNDVVVTDAIREALDGKVTFIKRNDLRR